MLTNPTYAIYTERKSSSSNMGIKSTVTEVRHELHVLILTVNISSPILCILIICLLFG